MSLLAGLCALSVPSVATASVSSLTYGAHAILADSTRFASLDGVVTDSLRQPIAGVEIYSSDGRFKTTTNAVGAFHLGGLTPGRVTFGIRKIGYGAGEFVLAMEPGATRYQTIVMTRLNNRLSPVVVEEMQSHRGLRDVGFYQRAENSRGTFLTPEILATRSSTRSSDLLRGVNGVRITSDPRGGVPYSMGGYMRMADRAGVVGAGYCVMNLYIDGVRTDLTRQGNDEPMYTLEDLISPQDIGAIEVYPSGVTSPQKYTGVSQGCGTILIWSKVKLNLPRDGSEH